jgi:5-formyltetrahydrofolate cyclo-ligase
MFDTKAKQRERILQARTGLSDAEIQEKSHKICQKALELVNERGANNIHVYLPIESKNEVDTWLLVKELLKRGISVSTSIFGDSRSLKHVKLQEDTIYDIDQLGIPIPTNNFTQAEEQYDLIFVPLVGFDNKMRRLGYGRGVYDSFLKEQSNAYKIGLAYEIQKIKRIKTEKHDEKLDAVITEL